MMMMMRSCSARTPPTVVVENTKKVRHCFSRFKFSLCAFGVVVYASSSLASARSSLFCSGEILFG